MANGVLITGDKYQSFKNDGTINAGGSLTFYSPGTTNLKTVYSDQALTTPITNPVTLDSAGRATVFGDGTNYDLYVKDSTGTLIYSVPNIYTSPTATASMAEWTGNTQDAATSYTGTKVDGTSFTVSTNLTSDFHVGRRVKIVDGGSTLYGYIYSSTYSAPNTTVKVNFDSGSIANSSITVYLSLLRGDNLAVPDTLWGTGDVKLTFKTAADSGWVLMNDTTIGDASSGATGRASADTSALFTLLWNNTADHECPVSTGRGASASADFAAHKTISLPLALGRALATYGTGTQRETYTSVTATGNAIPIASNNTKWITGMQVTVSGVSGWTSPPTTGTRYIIRQDATNIKLASSLANAQNGTADTITGTGNITIAYALTARVLGEIAGEEAHAMSSTELLSHTHPLSSGAASNVVSPNQGNANGTGSTAPTVTVGSTGGNAAMNVMQPTLFLNVMIKL